ncbi:hypothetical protein Tco_0335676 [Tanacetum coccineum]
MVAYLEKTTGNSEFHEIVDFLTSSLIHHALTISPTIYISYIKQFWNTASSQIVNDEKKIHATVDSKAVVVIEASIRSSLLLNDADGTACLINEAIFQNLALMGSKSTSWNEFSTNIALAVICLATNQQFNFSKLIFNEVEEGDGSEQPTEPQPTSSPTQPSVGDQPYVTESSSGPDNTHSPSMNLEGTGGNKGDQVQLSNDSPHSGGNTSERAEGGLNLEELLSLCTNLSNRVLALENSKDAQAAKILKLKTRIKKLEKKCKPSISHHRAWLKSMKRLSMKKTLGKKGASHGMDYMDIEEAVTEGRQSKETEELNVTRDTEVLEKGGSNEEPVNVAGNIGVSTAVNISTASRPEVSTATPMTPPTTTSVFEDEDIFLADALLMLSDKAKLKGPLLKIDPKDKGKGVLKEEPGKVKVKSKDQVQARIDADHELAVRWTQEEQEMYTMDERAKLLAEYFENKKKKLAEERAAAIRNKPLIKSQLRSLMMTYLKHTDFVPIGSEEDERLIQKMNKMVAGVHEEKVLKEPDSTKVEVKQEGNKESTRKRPGRRLTMKETKKFGMQKTDSNLEEEEHLKTFLKLVPNEEGIIDYEVLEKRFLILNWELKFYHLDRHGAECIYYRIFRSDESSRWIKTFSEMVTMFDRLDLEELYNLVTQRFESSTPEGVDLVLWGDLRTMFDANVEDDIWKNQEEWILRSWNFYENCGVHTLTLEDGTEIHMLAERKYPLTKETLERMMSLKLIAESASESAYNLLRFIQKQIDE